MGWDKDSLHKEYTKQVMYNAVAHHPHTDAQLIPEQHPPTPDNSPSFIVQHGAT